MKADLATDACNESVDPTGLRETGRIIFEGVSPELLRATAPSAEPRKRHASPESSASSAGGGRNGDRHWGPLDLPVSRALRVTGEEPDPYGLRQGKKACLRSVLDRVRAGRMSAVEEARAMAFLMENEVVGSQAELSKAMERPKSKVSEKLSILKLPKSVLLLMERHPDVITEGHAVELLRLKDEALISNVATRIIEQGLTRDRLRLEIGFLLKKHGTPSPGPGKRTSRPRTFFRYFPRVDGGFDVIYRFRPDGAVEDLGKMVADLEAKLSYLQALLPVASTPSD